jgi:hypothetical protein
MYLPNNRLKYFVSRGHSAFGQPLPASSHFEPCAIVSIEINDGKTPISGTHDASTSSAEEQLANAVILVGPKTRITYDMVIEVAGQQFKVTGKQPRFDLSGRVDHYQLAAKIWKS